MEIRSGVGRIMSVVASDIGRGLVVQSGDWSVGRTGVGREERDLSVCVSGIQRGLIRDRYALQSERVIFYPIIPDQAIKSVGGWSAVWCECSFKGYKKCDARLVVFKLLVVAIICPAEVLKINVRPN